jgi:HEAT repeat protein
MALIFILALLAGDDKAVTDALEKFKTDYKAAKETDAKVKAIEELAELQNDKITAKLASLFTAEEKGVRIAAAKALGNRTDEKDKKKAALALSSVLKPNEKFPDVQTAILEAIAKLGDETALSDVHKLLESEADGIAVAAVSTEGAVRSRTSFDPLIKRLKEADEVLKPRDQQPQAGGGKGGLGGFGGGRMLGGPAGAQNGQYGTSQLTPKERRDLAKAVQTAIMKLLADWTGTHCQDGKDWESWWKEHQTTFKFAKS